MGMYTKFNCIIPLKKDTPNDIKTVLISIVDGDDMTFIRLPNHPFFNTNTRKYFARSSSYYFTGTNNSNVKYAMDNIVLHIDCDFKNYNDEIDLFLDFVKSYIDEDCFLGYSLYEEDAKPILYYCKNGNIIKE